jgi:hypothetical protein
MNKVFESTAAQMNAALQRIGANVGLEMLSWPGGYFMAASVWLYKEAAILARSVIEKKRGRQPLQVCEGYRLVQLPKESRR